MSSDTTVSVTTNYDSVELWRMIMGGGWDIWDWWVASEYRGGDWDIPCTLVVTAWGDDEGEDPSLYVTREINIADVVAALESLVGYGMVGEHLANKDFDANTSDCVIQQCVYGEVIYG
jgi:hypothetical protein